MNERQQTCEERIPLRMASRVEDFKTFAAIADEGGDWDSLNDDVKENAEALEIGNSETDKGGNISDRLYERASEYPLCVTSYVTYKIELSTGGPADWLEVAYDPEDSVVRGITYHFSDWFDHAERDLTDDDLEAAERFFHMVVPT